MTFQHVVCNQSLLKISNSECFNSYISPKTAILARQPKPLADAKVPFEAAEGISKYGV